MEQRILANEKMLLSFKINSTIAWIFLAVIPIMAVLLYLIIRKVNPIFNHVFQTYDELNNVVQENVRGIRVVKSFNREDYEIGKFRSISEMIYHYFTKGEKLIAFNSPIMQFFMYACMILISWIGAKAIVASGNNSALGMTTGDLTALLSYATQILTSLRYSNRTENSCYDGGDTDEPAGLPLCSIMTKEYGVTHFTELHRILHKYFLIWRCQNRIPVIDLIRRQARRRAHRP